MTGDTVTLGKVWVLDFSAEGPEPGDYTGYQSVHATRDGAGNRLLDYLIELGLAYPGANGEAMATAKADDGSYAADLEIAGVTISYGVHYMPVEA